MASTTPTSAKIKSSLPSKRVPSANPRGPRWKKPPPELNEQLAVLKAMSDAIEKGLDEAWPLSPKQVSALTGRKPKTLERDRREQRSIIEGNKGKPLAEQVKIDPLHPMSLPYLPPSVTEREVQYIVSDLLAYLKRRAKTVDRSFLRRAQSQEDPALRGLQSWLSTATASDTWPFCIQEDGRPLDICEAFATKRLTEDAVRLNISEFTEQLAKAVSKAHTQGEKKVIAKVAKAGKKAASKKVDRWNKSGGPI